MMRDNVSTPTQACVQSDNRHVLHPWADLSSLGEEAPLVLTEAMGARVIDSEGNVYLAANGV
jgi:putrescine aminotransferase